MAERKHRHIMEIAYSLLLSAGVPNTFCGGPILTDVYLTNIILYVITSSISPFERLFGKLLDYFSSRVLVVLVLFCPLHASRTKLTPRSVMLFFLAMVKGKRVIDVMIPSIRNFVSRHESFSYSF